MPSYLTGSRVAGFPVSPDYRIAALQAQFVNGNPPVWQDLTITYSFPTGNAQFDKGSNYGKGEVSAGWIPFSGPQQESARKALAAWSNVSAIKFVEVADSNNVGDIRFAFTSLLAGTILGQGYYPENNSASAGDVWINAKSAQQSFVTGKLLNVSSVTPDANNPVTNTNYYTLLHEIGHALGLSHPFAKDGETRGTAALPTSEDSQFNTVMSYNSGSDLYGGSPTTPMPYDILAIQYLYGTDFFYHTGNDSYTYDVSDVNYETIWDAGGIDTLIITNKGNVYHNGSVLIDIREGKASGIGFSSFYASTYGQTYSNGLTQLSYRGSGKVAIAYKVTIENVVASNLNDNIIGNDANNRIDSGGGYDTLDGGGGIDTSVYSRQRADYTLSSTVSGFKVQDKFASIVAGGADLASDTLINVERLQFSDAKIAIDLNGNAGKAVKLLGAVFGTSFIANKEYVGIGIKALDDGMSFSALMDAALNVRLGSNADSAALVNLLFGNIVGAPAGSSDLALYTGMLNSGSISRADLGIAAAEHALNLAHIGFVGLASSGVEYI